jgi:MoxR-like ATPase
MASTKNYFLTRKKTFVEVQLLKTGRKNRRIKFLDGDRKGKEANIHPIGVAWGNLYPRLFESTTVPSDFFIFKGRILIKKPIQKFEAKKKVIESTESKSLNWELLIPEIDINYRFQPFLKHIIDGINANEPVLLVGGTGVGKTTHILQVAARTNQPTLRANFNGETRLSDFIGKMTVVNNETVWQDGILPLAMRNGYWLVLDELDAADPSVLTLLHPVLEDNPVLVLKENSGEVIKPHPNFRIFATANSIGAMEDRAGAYAGTNKMNEAFVDRWSTTLMVPNMPLKEELLVIKKKIGGIKHRWALKICEFAQKARDKQFDGYDFPGDNFSTRRVLNWASKTALLRSPLEGAQLAWLDKISTSEHEAIYKVLGLSFGSGKRKKDVGNVNVLDYQGKEKKNNNKKSK